MKVTEQGVIITEVPGIESIVISAHRHAQHGVRISITEPDQEPFALSMDELEQVITAYSRALHEAKRIAVYEDTP